MRHKFKHNVDAENHPSKIVLYIKLNHTDSAYQLGMLKVKKPSSNLIPTVSQAGRASRLV